MRAFFFIALCLLIPQLCKSQFKPPPVLENLPSYNPDWEFSANLDEIAEILNQPFTYLASGNQANVFESQDGQYVLKIFRYRRSLFPIVHCCKNLFKRKEKMDLSTKINKTLNAAHLACTVAKEFTLAFYCHLNLSNNSLPLTKLIIGSKTFTLPMDRYRFVLQKKVKPFKEALLDAKNDPEKMRRLINSFCSLLIERSKLNIRNSDPNLGPNFGFLGERAVEMDFGNYHLASFSSKEIENLLGRFEKWLNINAPEYLDDLLALKKTLLPLFGADGSPENF